MRKITLVEYTGDKPTVINEIKIQTIKLPNGELGFCLVNEFELPINEVQVMLVTALNLSDDISISEFFK